MSEPEKKKFEISSPMAILLAGFIIAGAILYTNSHPAAVADAQGQGQAQLAGKDLPQANRVADASASDHIIGSPSAPLVLIEYSDFQCPYCSMIYPTLKAVVDASHGQIAWVMRNYPLESLHPQAMPAANAAECIYEQLGDKGWWEFSDAVFAHQDKLSTSYYAQLAREFGAGMGKYQTCVDTNKYQSKITQQIAQAQNAGANGTPYTIVAGKGKQIPVVGALPQDALKSVLQGL